MRTKVMYPGLTNSQKIRVMIDGFGMYMRVKDIQNICTMTHRAAIDSAVLKLASSQVHGDKITSFGSSITVYDSKLVPTRVDVQVDLITE